MERKLLSTSREVLQGTGRGDLLLHQLHQPSAALQLRTTRLLPRSDTASPTSLTPSSPCLLNPAHRPHSPWPCFFAQAVSSHRHCSSSQSLPIHQLCSRYQPGPNTQEVVQPSSTSPSHQHLAGMTVTKCAATPAFLTSPGPLHSDSPHMLTAPQKETQKSPWLSGRVL